MLLIKQPSLGGEAERARLGLVVPPWRREHACGANCLFTYLFLFGKNVNHDSLLDEVQVSARGVSLAELRRVAGRHGVQSSTVFASPESLPKLNTPFIAHMLPNHSSSKDHYVVIVTQEQDNITIIDGDDGQIKEVARGQFEAGWSGYLVIPEEGGHGWPWAAGCLILAVAAIGLATYRQIKSNRGGS
jgi:ABC-type bacteriocin/lantibiotic exporter with double-glycine peptidase domain